MKNISQLFILFLILSLGLTSCATEPQEDTSIVKIESDGDGKFSLDIDADPEKIEKAAEAWAEKINEAVSDININITDDNGNKVNIDNEGIEEAAKLFGTKINEAVNNINININDKEGDKIETVSFRELKKLLPYEVAGVERIEAGGQKSGMFGLKVSTAEAKYEEGNKWAKVTIVDVGGIGMAIRRFADWSTMEIEKETRDGYEHTTEIDGHKAFIKWNNNSQRGEINVIVKDRFIINIEGKNIDIEDLEEVLEDIDLSDLEDLE